jgi:hypothetical protein
MSTVNTIITVRSSSDHTPIAGAKVFANGLGHGTTDITGKITLTLISGSTYTLSIKSPNFVTFITSGVLANQPSFVVEMEAVRFPIVVNFSLTIQPEDAAQGVPIVFSNSGHPVNANYSIGGVVVSGLTPGPQVVTGNVPGYVPINQTFDVSTSPVGTIQLTASSDNGLAQKQQTQPTQDPDSNSLLPALTKEQSNEFIAPNTGQGTYFTMTQARMYIGNLFIDELNGLQFVLQDNKVPIFGYASRFYDALAQGKSLVQGQFSINFISEGYLYTALNAYTDVIDQDDLSTNQVADQQLKRLTSLTNSLQNPDPAWTPDMVQAAKDEIQSLAGSLGPDAITAANGGIAKLGRQQNNSILGLPGGDYPNAVYTDVGFDIVVQYTGAGRTITRRLEDCHLISNESIMDHSGTPILDNYGFIARRLR